jgi:UDP-glucose 4-epimerase
LKALVTGGAGFIGSHLVEALIDEGTKVRVIDNLSTGRADNLTTSFIHGDIRNPRTAADAVKGVDVVFHLAAEADVSKSVLNHMKDSEAITMMLNLLEGMDKHGVRDMVFTSSSAVYGDSAIVPTPEESEKNPISLYGAAKLSCEAFGRAFTEISGIRVWAFRLANPIGERSRKGVIWNFVHFLKENPKQLTILGNGQQTKGFFYVKDCIEGMLRGYTRAGGNFNVFNLAHDKPTTVTQIADIVIDEMGLSGVEKVYKGGTRGWVGDIPVSVLSIDKMKALGWKPRTPPEEAIRKAARWVLANP